MAFASWPACVLQSIFTITVPLADIWVAEAASVVLEKMFVINKIVIKQINKFFIEYPRVVNLLQSQIKDLLCHNR